MYVKKIESTPPPPWVLATLPNPTPPHPTHNPGGGGGSLVFSYIRRLGSFFFLGGGGKISNIFWGMKILWIFFLAITKWTIFRGHFYAF